MYGPYRFWNFQIPIFAKSDKILSPISDWWIVSGQYPGKSIRASGQKKVSGQKLSQPILANPEISIRAETCIRASRDV